MAPGHGRNSRCRPTAHAGAAGIRRRPRRIHTPVRTGKVLPSRTVIPPAPGQPAPTRGPERKAPTRGRATRTAARAPGSHTPPAAARTPEIRSHDRRGADPAALTPGARGGIPTPRAVPALTGTPAARGCRGHPSRPMPSRRPGCPACPGRPDRPGDTTPTRTPTPAPPTARRVTTPSAAGPDSRAAPVSRVALISRAAPVSRAALVSRVRDGRAGWAVRGRGATAWCRG